MRARLRAGRRRGFNEPGLCAAAGEGRGIAGAITRHALDYSREQGWKVIPNCPYVAAWIKRHPEYQNLVANPDN